MKKTLLGKITFQLVIYTLLLVTFFTVVLTYVYQEKDKEKFDLLTDQVAKTIKPFVMVGDEIAIRQQIDKLLEDRHIHSLDLSFSDTNISVNWKNEIQTGQLSSIHKEYNLYPNTNQKFSIKMVFKIEPNYSIYLIMGLVALLFVGFAIILFYRESSKVIYKEAHKAEIDAQKSKIAARIFHQIESDANQIEALVEDEGNNISARNRILLRSIKNTIISGAERFTQSQDGNYNTKSLRHTRIDTFLKDLIDRKNVEFSRYQIPPIQMSLNNLGSTQININYEKLISAFSELLNNAKDAVIDKSCDANILIKLTLVNNILSFEIKDNGLGIEKTELTNILKDGYSLKGSKGLGLANAINLIKMMEGDFQLASTPQIGTTITVSFIANSQIAFNQNYHSVYIDDSKLNLVVAKKKANNNGKNLLTFNSFEEYFQAMNEDHLLSLLPLFTDSDLGTPLRGEEYARVAKNDYNVKSIFLATGDPNRINVDDYSWISKVISKNDFFSQL